MYIDTGAMYRAVTLFAMRKELFQDQKIDVDELIARLSEVEISFRVTEKGERRVTLNGEDVEDDIREMAVSNRVSEVAAVHEVRTKLVDLQRKIGADRGVVMDGRDIGTVVFPDAELKIFMTASIPVRTQRRYDELHLNGKQVTLEEVRENLESRDYIDSHREVDPLVQADGAWVLDNSSITREEQLEMVLEKVASIIGQ